MQNGEEVWWITPVATLVAAFLGGMVPMVSAFYALEVQAERNRMGSLLNKTERLSAAFNEYLKYYFYFMKNYEIDQHIDDRHDLFLPCHASLRGMTEMAYSLISETDDQSIESFLDRFFEKLDEIECDFKLLYHAPRYLKPNSDQVQKQFEWFSKRRKSLNILHDESMAIIDELILRSSDLKRYSDRSILDRVRSYVEKA